MKTARHVAVIDIGKTNAKVLLVDLADGREVETKTEANRVLPGPPYPHFDEPALWAFIVASLRDIGARRAVDAVSITTHGACGALTDAAGKPVLPVLDYEHDGPDALKASYDAVRPPFAETGSPRLPRGLNLGAQLHYLETRFPHEFKRAALFLAWPQYWAMKLTGVAASEGTSLGCHTDLWDPWRARLSGLVERRGWRSLFAPLRPAGAVLGPLGAEAAALTGLAPDTPVHCGIHDSNASLLPHLDGAAERFAVMSTGTWMITLAVGGGMVALDPRRDTLVNVDALGAPTPTARYMAGREFDEITGGVIVAPSDEDRARVLAARTMALPSLHPDTGPFPGLRFAWLNGEPASAGERTAAASFHAALMGSVCLELTGAGGPVFVEGPFGANRAFLDMLATACGRPVVASGKSAGTGLGAAMLAGRPGKSRTAAPPVSPSADAAMRAYAAAWREAVDARWRAAG